MPMHKCLDCGGEFDQVTNELMVSVLSQQFESIMPRLLSKREDLGLQTPKWLNSETLARMLLQNAFMCPSCFDKSDSVEKFTEFMEMVVSVTEASANDDDFFVWKEIYK